MGEVFAAHQSAALLERLHDARVGVEDQQALPRVHLCGEAAIVVQWTGQLAARDHDTGSETGVVVILTEGRRLVYDAGTSVGGDVAGQDDAEGTHTLAHVQEEVEGRVVANAFQLCAGECRLQHLVRDALLRCLVEQLQTRGAEQVDALGLQVADLGVDQLRVHGQRQVTGQSPRRGSPGQQAHVLVVECREGDHDRRINTVHVVGLGLEE
mmetsp:Transcript_24738/g.62083  ORF Transcript_24738/g.62083 Transcript_24738/m.62083 type:complete len:211 (+) Transcript_24738:2173-2805(+)